jgi:membrane carboxypeptidase/penicillin-binding protein PbpC
LPSEYQHWAAVAGIPQPPDGYDTILSPPSAAGAQITSPALFAYLHDKTDILGSANGEGFSSYYLQFGQGLNPRTWQLVAPESSQPVDNGTLAVWDTTGLNGLYALRLVVVRQNQRIDTAILQVTVDNTSPVAKVIYPSPGQTFSLPEDRQITLQAEIEEQVGVRSVEWYLDGKKIGETTQAPHIFPWVATPGDHTFVVEATDLAGNSGTSPPVKFVVK